MNQLTKGRGGLVQVRWLVGPSPGLANRRWSSHPHWVKSQIAFPRASCSREAQPNNPSTSRDPTTRCRKSTTQVRWSHVLYILLKLDNNQCKWMTYFPSYGLAVIKHVLNGLVTLPPVPPTWINVLQFGLIPLNNLQLTNYGSSRNENSMGWFSSAWL